MDKLTHINSTTVVLPQTDIDTDQIIPARFLTTTTKEGLGDAIFAEWRYDDEGQPLPDFPLNSPAAKAAQVLVAGNNFGCGSSREHAPWAIADFGIRCVISTSFADIFFNNCFKNGILPIALPQDVVDILMADAEKGENARMTVDLEAQTVTTSDGQEFAFEVDAFKKHCLLEGLDDIGLTMEKSAAIDSFETQASQQRPWV